MVALLSPRHIKRLAHQSPAGSPESEHLWLIMDGLHAASGRLLRLLRVPVAPPPERVVEQVASQEMWIVTQITQLLADHPSLLEGLAEPGTATRLADQVELGSLGPNMQEDLAYTFEAFAEAARLTIRCGANFHFHDETAWQQFMVGSLLRQNGVLVGIAALERLEADPNLRDRQQLAERLMTALTRTARAHFRAFNEALRPDHKPSIEVKRTLGPGSPDYRWETASQTPRRLFEKHVAG